MNTVSRVVGELAYRSVASFLVMEEEKKEEFNP